MNLPAFMGSSDSGPAPGMIAMGVTTVYVFAFFHLLELGMPAHQALAITITLSLGGAQVLRTIHHPTCIDRGPDDGRDRDPGNDWPGGRPPWAL